MNDGGTIQQLVHAAGQGDQRAWDELVVRYSPLLAGVIGRFRLPEGGAEDVAQTVWLRLVEHLGSLREAQALPMWIVTTARREALRHLQSRRWITLSDELERVGLGQDDDEGVDQGLLRGERREAHIAGLAELPGAQRSLLLLFLEDPPLPYAEIARRAGIPVGSIGPTRARALDRLRRTAPIRAFAMDVSDSDGHR